MLRRNTVRLRALFRVALVGAAGAALACGASPVADTDAGGDAGDEASCLLCGAPDAGDPPWTNASLPLARRMATMLHDCTGAEACHSAGTGGLTIAIGDEFAQLINVPSNERPELKRVAPGDPSRSYLYLKLAGDGGIDGAQMPASGTLDPRRPALAWQWIEAGAPTQ